MNIVKPKGKLEELIGTGLWIELVPTRKGLEFSEYFTDVDIDIMSAPFVQGDGIVRIQPVWESSSHILYFGEPRDEKLSRQITVADFRNSRDFYAKLTGKKAGYKVLYDRVSFFRSKELYEHIAQVEQYIREKYVAEVGYDDLPVPQKFRSDSVDHRITQFDLFELTAIEFLKPASDDYFELQISIGLSPTDARKLTRLDEFGIPLSGPELNRFRQIRNSIMHFKVVTNDDVAFIVDAHSKMSYFHLSDIVYKSINNQTKG